MDFLFPLGDKRGLYKSASAHSHRCLRVLTDLGTGVGVSAHITSLDASPVAAEMGLQGCSGVPPTSLPP